MKAPNQQGDLISPQITVMPDEKNSPGVYEEYIHHLISQLERRGIAPQALIIALNPTRQDEWTHSPTENPGIWISAGWYGAETSARKNITKSGSPIPIPAEAVPDDETVRGMRDAYRDVEVHDCTERFQGREIQILQLMARGATNNEIADTIYLSVNTVRWYARQIYAKLQVRRRGEAVQAAWKYGLIGTMSDSLERRCG